MYTIQDLKLDQIKRVAGPLINGFLLVLGVHLFGLYSRYIIASKFFESFFSLESLSYQFDLYDSLVFLLPIALITIVLSGLYSRRRRSLYILSFPSRDDPDHSEGLNKYYFRSVPKNRVRILGKNLMAFVVLLPMLLVLVTTLVMEIWILIKIILFELVTKYNFYFSLAISILITFITLRLTVIRSQTWKKLKDEWLSWWNIKYTTAAIFWLPAAPIFSIPQLDFIKKAIEISQLNKGQIGEVFAFSFFCLFIAILLHQIGATCAEKEDSNDPIKTFYSSFSLAVLSNISIYALIFNGGILTIYTYIS